MEATAGRRASAIRIDSRLIAATITVSVFVVGALIAARRASGALNSHLESAPLFATALLAGVIILGARAVWLRGGWAPKTAKQAAECRLFAWTGTFALWSLACGCSLPDPRQTDWLAWLPLLVADQIVRQLFISRLSVPIALRPPVTPERPSSNPFSLRVHALEPVDSAEAEEIEEELVGDELSRDAFDSDPPLQQLTRRRDAEGVESISGFLRADFEAEQRTATLHVGFCPPLTQIPEVSAELAYGPEGSVKIIQAFCHGARIDVRLAESAEEPCFAVIEFHAA